MAEPEVLLYMILLLLTFTIYGLKWSVLLSITLFVVKITIDTYSTVGSRANGDLVRNQPNRSGVSADDTSFYTANSDSMNAFKTGVETSGYRPRIEQNIYRRNPVLTQDIPFSNFPMYRSQSQRHSAGMKSSEPLLSQVTRHLSFSNASYYIPDKTRHAPSSDDMNRTVPNSSSFVSSQTSPRWYTETVSSQPQRRLLLDNTCNSIEQQYSPAQFTILSPQRFIPETVSTVKISRPGDGESDSRFALESILHKRLERTKDDPCSRHSVLSALRQKSRKRYASESDGSLVESYSVKKRRRDDLDDFLESVNNPSIQTTAPYFGVRSKKRPYLSSSADAPSEITRKRIREKTETGSESSPILNSPAGSSEDSGLDVNSPHCSLEENVLSKSDQAKVVQPTKQRKRKSVTFSDKLGDKCSAEQTSRKEFLRSTDGRSGDASNVNSGSEEDYVDNSPVFHTGFSPRKSLTPEYLSSISDRRRSEKKKLRSRSNITWKDIHENRREAWRRSQKLLDEIEESLSKEKKVTAALASAVTSLPASTLTSFPTSHLVTSVTTSTVSTSTEAPQPQENVSVTAQFTNFIGIKPSSEPQLNQEKKNAVQSEVSNGSIGASNGFAFNVPKSTSSSSSFTGLFGISSSTPAVSLPAPSLSGSTSNNLNATSQQTLNVQTFATSSATQNTLPTFSFQTSTIGSTAATVTQTSSAPATQNKTAGLVNFNSNYVTSIAQSNPQQSTSVSQNATTTTTNLTLPKTGGFSASAVTAANPTSGFSFSMPAITTPNVSGGFSFAAPSTEKPKTSGGVSFAAPAINKANTGGGFKFPAPQSDKANPNGGFQFNETTVSKTSGAFTFTAPTALSATSSGGFSLNAGDKPSTSSGGFNFGHQSTSGTFNFGSPAPAVAPGGFNFAASNGFTSSTPMSSNSSSVKSRQRRRPRR